MKKGAQKASFLYCSYQHFLKKIYQSSSFRLNLFFFIDNEKQML